MSETTPEITVMEAEEQRPQPPRLRVKVGLVASFLAHQSIYGIGTALMALLEKNAGVSHVFQNSPSSLTWLAAWLGGTTLFWRYKRPQLLEWATPLPLFSFYWIVAMGLSDFAAGWHTEVIDHQIYTDFALTMAGTCGGLWLLAVLLSRSGFVLGNGHIQKVQIRRWMSGFVPAFRRYHDAPQDLLVQISPPAEALPEYRAPFVPVVTESAPQQIVCASSSSETSD